MGWGREASPLAAVGWAGGAGEVDEGDGDAAGAGGVDGDYAPALEGGVWFADGVAFTLHLLGEVVDALHFEGEAGDSAGVGSERTLARLGAA